jgi:hypothetical protein
LYRTLICSLAAKTRSAISPAPDRREQVRRRPTRSRGRRAGALVAAVAVAAVVPVAAVPTATAAAGSDDCVTSYPTSQLRPGMTAVGLTVSNGDTPEPFNVEILGVLHDGIAPGIDMILTRTSSPALTAAGGVWAGMSGSPVYASDGRLIGALSYSLSGGPSLTAGLTPAAAMFDVLNDASKAARLPALAKRTTMRLPRSLQESLVRTRSATRAQAASGLVTLPDPISISGLSSRRLAAARPRLARLGLAGRTLSASAATSASAASAAPPPVPGGNFAALASTGDATIGGIGTATYVCNGTVLAFGHEDFGVGATTQTAHRADAVEVQPDPLFGPFKVANIGAQFGALDSDRLVGVRARAGTTTPTTRIVSDITDQSTRRSRHGVTSVSLPSFLPSASYIHLLSNSDTATQRIGEGTNDVTWTISGTRAHGAAWTLTRRNTFASQDDIADEAAWELPTMLQDLLSNRFQAITINTVRVHASITPTFNQYALGSVLRAVNGRYVGINPHRMLMVRAGTVLKLRVVLTPYQGHSGSRTVDYSVRIPSRARGGGVLTIADGQQAPAAVGDPEAATSFGDLLHRLTGQPTNDTLATVLELNSTSAPIQHTVHLGAAVTADQVIRLRVQPRK